MTVVDHTPVDNDEDVLPPRKVRPPDPPPPAPAAGTAVPVADELGDTGTPKPAKRPPIARGTVALGGVAVAGTLLAVVGSAGGLLALVATAAGTILVPLAVWNRSNSRTGRRSSNRRGGQWGGKRTGGRRGFGSWLPGGLGGGGRRTPGLGGLGRRGSASKLGGTGRRGSTTGARVPGLAGRRAAGSGRTPGLGSAGRRAAGRIPGLGKAGRVPGLGPAGRRRTAAGLLGASKRGGAGNRRRVGTGANWKLGRSGPGKHGSSRLGLGKLGKLGQRGSAGRHDVLGGKHGLPGGKHGSRSGPGKVAGHAGELPRRRTPIGRAAQGVNRLGHQLGSATASGVKKQNGRSAFRKAYRAYGRTGAHRRTMTGYAGRFAGGVAAGLSAGTLRFLGNQIRKVRAKTATTTGKVQDPKGATPGQKTQIKTDDPGRIPKGQRHPVPPPAFTPNPGTTRKPTTGKPTTTGRPSPHPVGVGAGTTTEGTSTMTSMRQAHGHAADFYAACTKFYPVAENGKTPSIWPLQESLPLFVESMHLITNGFGAFVASAELTLEGGLHPGMRNALAEVRVALVGACRSAEALPSVFNRVYADAIERAATRGRVAENV